MNFVAFPNGRLPKIAEEGVPSREVATVIGFHLNVSLVSMTQEEASNHFGWFAPFAALTALPGAR